MSQFKKKIPASVLYQKKFLHTIGHEKKFLLIKSPPSPPPKDQRLAPNELPLTGKNSHRLNKIVHV